VCSARSAARRTSRAHLAYVRPHMTVITRCDSSGPLYTMCLPSRSTPSFVAAPTALVASASTWLHRLGHPGVDTMSKLSNAYSIICSRRTHDLCLTCQLGHHTRMPFVSSTSHVDNNFDLIHYDLWTSPIISIFGCKYYLVILDDRPHFVWSFPLRIKSDTFPTLSKNCLCFHAVWTHHQTRPV
jgi:hypothetical protein